MEEPVVRRKNLPFKREQLDLPDINLIEGSEQAFSNAFLKAAQITQQQFERIKLILEASQNFPREPFDFIVLGLFAKMSSQYYSHILLETHHDRTGSQLLIEQLSEVATTLTYLLEEADQNLVYEYISASVYQAHHLLSDVEQQLQQLPNHLDLLSLKHWLEDFINKHQTQFVNSNNELETSLWGTEEANTTTKRGAILGLNFLTNPARQIALRVVPASWLDLQLNRLNYQEQLSINFTCLRDAAHLCLYAAQALLNEVVNYQGINSSEIKHQQKLLTMLYEWFHNAHRIYQQQYAKIGQIDVFSSRY